MLSPFNQAYWGDGAPVALHVNTTESPTIAIISSGLPLRRKDGGIAISEKII